MKLKDSIKTFAQLRQTVEMLDLGSALAREVLLGREWSCDKKELTARLNAQQRFSAAVSQPEHAPMVRTAGQLLGQVRDIRGSVASLSKRQVLSEVELFEIKCFADLTIRFSELIEQMDAVVCPIPDLKPVFALLDPDATGNVAFYLYDTYCDELAALRKALKQLPEEAAAEREALFVQIAEQEQQVLTRLSTTLSAWAEDLAAALRVIADYDFFLSAARLYAKYRFSRPQLDTHETVFEGLFNPCLQELLERRGMTCQPVDIRIADAPVLITGANMSGKSMTLRSVALAQLLVQYGFYSTAASARVVLKDAVFTSFGDNETLSEGLSSFAGEMTAVDRMLKAIDAGVRPLVLVDELARTTNPVEGTAIVSALIDRLNEKNVSAIITTHYSGIRTHCRALRVRGVREERIDGKIGRENINDYMDYSLEEVSPNTPVPQEALRIAEIMGIDEELIRTAKKYINQEIVCNKQVN